MSHALYMTRLYWAHGRGIAKLRGLEVRLTVAPKLAGMDIDGIDYIPEVGVRMILPRLGGWRDMKPDEESAADKLLADLTRGAT